MWRTLLYPSVERLHLLWYQVVLVTLRHISVFKGILANFTFPLKKFPSSNLFASRIDIFADEIKLLIETKNRTSFWMRYMLSLSLQFRQFKFFYYLVYSLNFSKFDIQRPNFLSVNLGMSFKHKDWMDFFFLKYTKEDFRKFLDNFLIKIYFSSTPAI